MVRERSLLMTGRGPENILRGHKITLNLIRGGEGLQIIIIQLRGERKLNKDCT